MAGTSRIPADVNVADFGHNAKVNVIRLLTVSIHRCFAYFHAC